MPPTTQEIELRESEPDTNKPKLRSEIEAGFQGGACLCWEPPVEARGVLEAIPSLLNPPPSLGRHRPPNTHPKAGGGRGLLTLWGSEETGQSSNNYNSNNH